MHADFLDSLMMREDIVREQLSPAGEAKNKFPPFNFSTIPSIEVLL
jgi:hypothetical protein